MDTMKICLHHTIKSFIKSTTANITLTSTVKMMKSACWPRGATAASNAIIIDFINNMLNCTLEECLDYIVEMNFRFMRVDEKELPK